MLYGYKLKWNEFQQPLPWKYVSKTDHTNFVRLVKGGHVRICKISGKAPIDSAAAKAAPYGDSYYLMRVGACPGEVPDGTLRGRNRARRR